MALNHSCKVVYNKRFSANFLAGLLALNTRLFSMKSSKMIQSHFSQRTKQFVNRKTVYNMKLHYQSDNDEYDENVYFQNGCL